jgi:3-oxoadipate enol-lactonase
METRTKGYNLSIDVNNFSLSYDDVGEGSIPVIFLHGFPFDKTMWLGQLDYLKLSYRLIACDIRGFGESTDEKSALSIDLFGDDLIRFMDQLHIDKAVVCGLSMGGFIALNAHKRFPDRFEALALCDTQCIADTIEVKENRYVAIEKIKADGVVDFNEGFIKKVFHKDSITDKKELVDELRSVVFANSQHIIIEGLTALAERSETCSTLGDIKIPTLIICGREDEVTPLAESEFMNKQIKGSILQVIERAGHVSNLEQPDAFNRHLNDFLATLKGISATA